MKRELLRLSLGELQPAPCQVWGNVRIVPLLRERAVEHIRLLPTSGGAAPTSDSAYLPAALILGWSDEGAPLALPETWLGPRGAAPRGRPLSLHQMVKKLDHLRSRLLPLHVAVEALLAGYVSGPEIAWKGLSDQVLRCGLSPRSESFAPGAAINALAEALRVFEIHPRQCGALLFIGDALASAFAVGHPDDYRALHGTVIEDLYAELLVHHGRLAWPLPITQVRLDETGVESLADLERALEHAEQGWRDLQLHMAAGLLHREVSAQRVRSVGGCHLMRFFTGSDEAAEQHVGELLLDPERGPIYLHTSRLDRGQVRRAALLEVLAAHAWNPRQTAEALGLTDGELHSRLYRSGLGYVLAR